MQKLMLSSLSDSSLRTNQLDISVLLANQLTALTPGSAKQKLTASLQMPNSRSVRYLLRRELET